MKTLQVNLATRDLSAWFIEAGKVVLQGRPNPNFAPVRSIQRQRWSNIESNPRWHWLSLAGTLKKGNCAYKLITIFAQSDTAATIYFIIVLCGFYSREATNREQRLLNSVLSVKSCVNLRALRKSQFYKFNKELWSGDLVLKQTFQLLDQPPLCYKVVPTQLLQSISSFFFYFSDFTRWSPSVPPKMPNYCAYCVYSLHCFDIAIRVARFMCAHATWILAVEDRAWIMNRAMSKIFNLRVVFEVVTYTRVHKLCC